MSVTEAVVLTIGSSVVIAGVAVTLTHFVPKWVTKYKVWKLGRQKASLKVLASGEVVIKTEKDLYFLAVDRHSLPVLLGKEEGERLWNMG